MPTTNFLRLALVLYGVLNAVLYCSLLPLWEGFDEPFHYGYVQSLSVERRLPVLGETVLSDEIWESLRLAPVSHLVKLNIPAARSYSEYFALSVAERTELRRRLEGLDPGLQLRRTARPPNYEAQQAPLAYVVSAALDWLWSSAPLTARIWRLRLVCALGAVLLTCWGILRLTRRLGIPEAPALFLVLSTQTFYAATAHITNDWLAVPLVLLLLDAALETRERPGRFAVLLALGLLTKAYFLAFLPLAAWVLWRRWEGVTIGLAVPWYLRNLLLYGSLSAMHERVGLGQALAALPAIPWGKSALAVVRGGLWTANNSFTTFSAHTMYLLWGVLLVAAVQYARRGRREPVLLAGIGCYALGLIYSTAVKFVVSGGEGFAPSVWYLQPLLAPVLCLLLGAAGRWVRAALVALWAYVILATWWLKLVPLYGGYPAPRVRLGELLGWYRGPFGWVFPLAVAASVAAVVLGAATIYTMTGKNMTRKNLTMLCLAAAACVAAFWLGRTTSVEAKSNRVFEIRTYTALEGRLDALHARFKNHTLKIFEKHGMTNIGYWQPADEPLSKDTLIYILAHPSREAAKKAWDGFRNDPEWKKAQAESEASGKIVKKVESVFLDATDYSPLQ